MILKIFLTPYKNFPAAPKVMVLKLLCALQSLGVLVKAIPTVSNSIGQRGPNVHF